MSCPDAATATAALIDALGKPKLARGDGMEVEQFDLKDIIAAINYLKEQCAADAVNNPRMGLRITKLIPDGTV